MASPPPDAMDEEIPSVGGILSLPQSVKAIQASEGGNSVPMARITFVEERGFVKVALALWKHSEIRGLPFRGSCCCMLQCDGTLGAGSELRSASLVPPFEELNDSSGLMVLKQGLRAANGRGFRPGERSGRSDLDQKHPRKLVFALGRSYSSFGWGKR
jgi:hypothetical protein